MTTRAVSNFQVTGRSPVPGIPDAVFLRTDDVPLEIAGAEPAGLFAQAKPGQLLFSAPGIGRFLVSEGIRITYIDDRQADPGAVQLVLHGSARTALVHQRGELPLHAATLMAPGGVCTVALCGPSGAGKSTLAAELAQRGWLLIADDTTRLTWNGTAVLAWPSRGLIKLWRDACERRGLDTSVLEPVTRDLDKFYVPTPSYRGHMALSAVVALDAGEIEDTGMKHVERMALIMRNTSRLSYVRPLHCQASHLAMASRVVTHCRFLRLSAAPRRAVATLANAIEQTFC